MSEWNEVQLSDIAVISSGKRPPCSVKEMTSDCRTPIIGGGGISGYTNAHLFDGDILITGRVGTLGKLFAPSVPCWPSDNALVIRPGSSTTHPHFLRYALQSVIVQAADMNRGAANPLITQGDLGRLNIWHPPLPEQRAIAHILGTLDDKIELNRRQSETLQEMARALFKAWFVDFEPVRAKMSGRWLRGQTLPGLPAHLWDLFPDRLVETEHGEVPQGWTIEPFASAIDFKEGPGIRNWQYTNSEDGIRFINIRCIQNGDLALASANRIAEEEANGKYRHFLLQPWDIVVSTSGTLGRSAIVREEHLPLVLNTSVIRFRPVHGKTAFSYIHQYLTGEEFLEKLDVMASGSVQKNFGPMHLKQIGLLLPSFDVMQKYEAICRPIYENVLSYRSQSDTLTTLRDTLLPKLISGALRVQNLDEFLKKVNP